MPDNIIDALKEERDAYLRAGNKERAAQAEASLKLHQGSADSGPPEENTTKKKRSTKRTTAASKPPETTAEPDAES